MEYLKKYFAEVFYLDKRSLAVFRIFLGLTSIVVLYRKFLLLDTFFSDQGVLPREIKSVIFGSLNFSLFESSGEPFFLGLIFLFYFICLILFTVGYKTQASTILCWILLLSLRARNPLIDDAGDKIPTAFLLWAIYLPLGEVWSVDSLLKKNHQSSKITTSIASFAFIFQFFLIYFFTFLLKLHPNWLNGEAIYLALNLDELNTPIGKFLSTLTFLIKPLDYATLFLEGILPFCLFIPYKNYLIRYALILLFSLFHFGIAISFIFPHLAGMDVICWLAYLPSQAWNKIEQVKPFLKIKAFLKSQIEITFSLMKKINSTQNLAKISCIFLLILVIHANLISVKAFNHLDNKIFNLSRNFLGINQAWFMFAPTPPESSSQIIILEFMKNGDLLSTKPNKEIFITNFFLNILKLNKKQDLIKNSLIQYLCSELKNEQPVIIKIFLYQKNNLYKKKNQVPDKTTLFAEGMCKFEK